jgi:hypothetical protein
MEVGNLYFESLNESYLKNVMHHAPVADHRGQDIHFANKSTFHKIARVFYKVLRMLYVGVVFYFIPFAVMFIATFPAPHFVPYLSFSTLTLNLVPSYRHLLFYSKLTAIIALSNTDSINTSFLLLINSNK